MVPHHQGAIEMALAELRYGRNEPLRRMAQEIIVPPSVPSADQISPAAMNHSKLDNAALVRDP
jgi:hypothetical protein